MPIYEYLCNSCERAFEVLQSFDAANPECPACNGEVRRAISSPNFVLKGSGWYRDHYGLKPGGGEK